MLLTTCGLVLLSSFVAAPLAGPIQPGGQFLDARAPWFFLWVQQLLKWGDPFVFGVLVPLIVVGLLAAIPFIAPVRPEELGTWFPRSGRAAQVLAGIIASAVLILTLMAWLQV